MLRIGPHHEVGHDIVKSKEVLFSSVNAQAGYDDSYEILSSAESYTYSPDEASDAFFGPFEATRHSEIVELVHKNGHVRLGNDPVVITRLTAVVEEDFQWNKV
jgi:hypothetical protein